MMQALIPVFAILAVAAGARLTLLPYAYLADPFPVYHQSQDTRAGVHAYSYAGGPSAKEEVRGLDGVTRGSYSYVDAHGILQSVFYVADEGGFRVAATNLPTDGNSQHETSEILLSRNAQNIAKYLRIVVPEVSREGSNKAGEPATSRRKRSLEAPINQDRRQAENPSSQADQADRGAANASPKNSHELPAQEKKAEGRAVLVPPAYGLLDAILIPRLSGAATSHQSRVDVHDNVRLKAVQPVETIGVLSESAILPNQVPLATSHQSRVDVHDNVRLKAVQPVETIGVLSESAILPSQVPLATSHQSRVQVHNNLRVEVPEKFENAETIEILQPLIAAPSNYNEKRIQLHKSIGLEGVNPHNTIKIDAPQVSFVETPITEVRTIPVLAKESLSVPNKETVPVVAKDALPIVVKESLPVAAKEPLPVFTKETVVVNGVIPIVAGEALPVVTAVPSQSRSQVHRDTKPDTKPDFKPDSKPDIKPDTKPLVYPILSGPTVYLTTTPQPISQSNEHLPAFPFPPQFFQYCTQIKL